MKSSLKYRKARTSVVVDATPVGPGTVTTPPDPQPPTQDVTVIVDVAIVVTSFVVPFYIGS